MPPNELEALARTLANRANLTEAYAFTALEKFVRGLALKESACRSCEDGEYHRVRAEAIEESARRLATWAGEAFRDGKDHEAKALRTAARALSQSGEDERKHADTFARSESHTCRKEES